MTVDSRDTLFLRLCIRQGIFSQDDAQQLLAFYRDNRSHQEGIGEFLIRHEYLDQPTVDQIRSVISKRAEGHVAPPPPKARSGGRLRSGGSTVARAQQRRKQGIEVSSGQMAAIAVALVVMLVAVILIVVNFSSGPTTPIESPDEKKTAATSTTPKEESKPSASEAPEFSEAQLKDFRDAVTMVVNTASQTNIYRGPYDAKNQLEEERQRMRDERVPESILAPLGTEITKYEEICSHMFTDFQRKYREAKAADDEQDVENIVEEVRAKLGDGYVTRLTGAAEPAKDGD